MFKKKKEQLEALRAKARKVFEQAGADTDFSKVTEISGTDIEKAAAVRQMNDDMEKLGNEVKDLEVAENLKARMNREDADEVERNRKGLHGGSARDGEAAQEKGLSFGAAFTKAKAHEKANRNVEMNLDGVHGLKTLFERGAGWEPESIRSGKIVDFPVRPIQFLDLVPVIPTSQAAYKYMEETVLNGALAVEKAEGAAFGEVQLQLAERSATMEKLPCYLPVTDEQLEDVAGAMAYIDSRLPGILMRRLDSQGVSGDGATPNMRGVLNASGLLSTLASAGDGIADAILRGIKDVRVIGRAIASGICITPNDWLTERLRKTKGGEYIWGNPSEAGPTAMWGVPVAQVEALTDGTAIVGDFRIYSAYVERRGIVVKTGYINDDFIKGKQAIRADLRGGFVWYRGAAFSEVTLPA